MNRNKLRGLDPKVLEYLQSRKSATLYELRSHFTQSQPAIRQSVNSLRNKGLVIEEGDIVSYVS